jgi:hypothetical protein
VRVLANGGYQPLNYIPRQPMLYGPSSALAFAANQTVFIGEPPRSGLDTVVLPPALRAVSLTGGLTFGTQAFVSEAQDVIGLIPSAKAQLELLAGDTIQLGALFMDDRSPALAPGLFSPYTEAAVSTSAAATPFLWAFPNVASLGAAERRAQRFEPFADADSPFFRGRVAPELALILSDGDLLSTTRLQPFRISLPKQSRIEAGRDIVGLQLFGQNLTASDITRIAAARDIRSGIQLESFGEIIRVGNVFQIGGPGNVIVEAGRDAGPFLYSDVGRPGGILTVGNELTRSCLRRAPA